MTLANLTGRLNSVRLPRLILVTDAGRLSDPVAAVRRLPCGSGVLLRHYGVPGRERLAAGLAALARRRRLVLLVAADWRLAARVRAAGIHLPEALARSGRLAPLLGWARRRRVLVTAAAHSPAALAAARRLGADAALLSPVFPTRSHPGAPTIGAVRFAAWSRRAGLAVVALGGVRPDTVRRIRGAAAVAAVAWP